jgi:hypothetical protein
MAHPLFLQIFLKRCLTTSVFDSSSCSSVWSSFPIPTWTSRPLTLWATPCWLPACPHPCWNVQEEVQGSDHALAWAATTMDLVSWWEIMSLKCLNIHQIHYTFQKKNTWGHKGQKRARMSHFGILISFSRSLNLILMLNDTETGYNSLSIETLAFTV